MGRIEEREKEVRRATAWGGRRRVEDDFDVRKRAALSYRTGGQEEIEQGTWLWSACRFDRMAASSSSSTSSRSDEVWHRRLWGSVVGSSRGRSSNALSFLERSDRSTDSPTVAAATTNPWPVGFVPPQGTKSNRTTGWSQSYTPYLPRTSALAFLERAPGRARGNNIVGGAGAEDGLGTLSGGMVAAGADRGGFLPRPYDTGSECSDAEEDSDICPSMLYSCFPCFNWSRRGKRRPADLLDGGLANSVKRESRAQLSLGTPLLTEQPPSPTNFPTDVKLIEVEVESARNLPLGERVNMADLAGTYAILRITPVQEGVGEQVNQTSLATRPVNPSWGGRETFTFFVTDVAGSKAFLSLQLLYRPLRPPPAPQPLQPPLPLRRGASEASLASVSSGSRHGDVTIAEGFVDLLGLFSLVDGTYTPGAMKGNARRVAVPMREPKGKRRTRCSVMLGLRCRRVNETIDTREDRLYEYERWTRVAGWSTAGKKRAGKWSTLDGSALSDNFADVAPGVGEDTEVVLPWCPFGGWEYSRGEETPASTGNTGTSEAGGGRRDEFAPSLGAQEWENFAVAQKGAVWMEGYVQGDQAVRRRLWRRVTAA
ncbi:unnamed protein product [Ectocarpus sp. 6 AP-2014]